MACDCNTSCPTPGLKGPQGPTGATGATGATGPAGATGPQGPAGTNGTNGTDGNDGFGYDGVTSSTITDILDTGNTTVTLTVTTDKAYNTGARIRVTETANPTLNYFEGIVSAYNPTTGQLDITGVDLKVGSGTISAWTINIAGEQGATGAAGATGAQGIKGDQGDAGDDGVGYDSTTSTTSTDILDTAATTVTLTVSTDKAFIVGSRVRVADTSNPSVNYFEGVVNLYNPTTGQMDLITVDVKQGTGTLSSWNISITGEPGTINGAYTTSGIVKDAGVSDPVSLGPLAYSIDSSGQNIYLRGGVRLTGTGVAADTLLVTFPAAVHPSIIRGLSITDLSGGSTFGANLLVIVNAIGQAFIRNTIPAATVVELSFDGQFYSL